MEAASARLASLALLLSTTVGAQVPRLLDLNRQPRPNPFLEEQMARMGSWLYFVGTAPATGAELYRSAGPSNPPQLVRDIRRGKDGSFPFMMTNVGGVLYFFADDGATGFELWKSDGTAAGTVVVKDIRAGKRSSRLAQNWRRTPFVALGNNVIFAADDGVHGEELWKSDGTATGTVMLKDVFVGAGGSRPLSIVRMGNRVYFNATSNVLGAELWVTDGTPVGTAMVRDIFVGHNGGNPYLTTVVGTTMYFQAMSSYALGYELWKSDGTATGTVMVKDINPGNKFGYPSNFTALQNGVLFTSDSPSGRELFRTDGSASGTVLVKDVRPGAASGLDWYGFLGRLGNHVYFAANDGVRGWELWKSDGTSSGTVLVKDVHAGPGSSLQNWQPQAAASTTHLYFQGDDGVSGAELWRTDGTASGTSRVLDLYPGAVGSRPRSILALGAGLIAFVATDQNGHAVFLSQGTAATTWRLGGFASIGPSTGSSSPVGMVDVSGQLFLAANDGVTGYELWRSDGSESGTKLVKDIRPGSGSAIWNGDPVAPSTAELPAATMDDQLFFVGWGSRTTLGLWRSDGTGAGTAEIHPLSRETYGWRFEAASAGGRVYFLGRDPNGFGLWSTDGTTRNTTRIRAGIWPARFHALGNSVFYHAAHSRWDVSSLWRCKGTTNVQLASLPSRTSRYSVSYARLGRNLYTISMDGAGSAALRRLSETGTTAPIVKSFRLLPRQKNGIGVTGVLANAGGVLFFPTINSGGGSDLWKSDGTASGTALVRANLGGKDSSIHDLVVKGNEVFFTLALANNDHQLWKSDGTTTVSLLSIKASGARGRLIDDVVAVGSRRVFFTVFGELWQTDGTLTGTKLLVEGRYFASRLAVSGGRVFFRVNHFPLKGYELGVLDVTGVAHRFGHGCAASGFPPKLRATDPVLGRATQWSVEEAPANANGIVLLGAGLPRPAQMGSGCAIYLSTVGAVPFVVRSDATGRWRSPNLLVPNLPSLTGVRAVVQGAFGGTSTPPLRADLTNPVLLVPGR